MFVMVFGGWCMLWWQGDDSTKKKTIFHCLYSIFIFRKLDRLTTPIGVLGFACLWKMKYVKRNYAKLTGRSQYMPHVNNKNWTHWSMHTLLVNRSDYMFDSSATVELPCISQPISNITHKRCLFCAFTRMQHIFNFFFGHILWSQRL